MFAPLSSCTVSRDAEPAPTAVRLPRIVRVGCPIPDHAQGGLAVGGAALLDHLKRRVEALKTETYALYLAARHPRTPWYAKAFVAAVVAYAVSPIDLIPDFIPVLGLLDDLVLIPLGVLLALRMIPPEVMAESRAAARDRALEPGAGRRAAIVVVAIWIVLAAFLGLWAYKAWRA